MKTYITASAMALALSVAPAAAANDGAKGGAAGGAAAGAVGGAIVGGPVGAAVGAVTGAAAGTIFGELSAPDRRYAVQYVRDNRRPSVRMKGKVGVGTRLPRSVELYEFEGRSELDGYTYAYVNNRPVMVNPRSRKVIYVIR